MNFYVDLAVFVLAIALVFVNTKLVIRTEKGLDTAAKFFLATSCLLLVASILQLDRTAGILCEDYASWIFYVSRLLNAILFLSGCYMLLRITDIEIKK